MVKLTGKNKIKTAVFISGTGSNLKNLIKFSKYNKSPIQIKCVISDNKYAKGLDYAKKFKIEKKVFKFDKENKNEKKILDFLKKKSNFSDLSCWIYENFIQKFHKKFNGKILNIHPSLLPKYKGLNTHQRVIDNNEKFSGCTVHFVNSKLDSGKIILQKKVKVFKNDNSKLLAKRILKKEHILYPEAIMKVFSNL